MRFLSYLNEKFCAYVKGFKGVPFPVFINPSKGELREIEMESGYARYIINFTHKKIWVWSGDAALHNKIAKELKLDTNNGDNWMFYDSVMRSGKLVMDKYYVPYKAEIEDLSWLKPYTNDIKVVKMKP